MKSLILILTLMTSLNTFAQNYQTSKDPENGSVVLKGTVTMSDLAAEPSFSWFKQNAAYNPDTAAIRSLRTSLPGYTITVVMGTWCEDSQNLIPKLYTVLQDVHYPMDKVTMFGVDRTKNALNNEKAKYLIEKVPTIILYKDGTEAGRITETAQESIERDLMHITEQ
jgi:thiol-disulfide isomerase/thioredoxin